MNIDMRLVKIFNETLARLPRDVRFKIEGFWRAQQVQEYDGQPIPPVIKKPSLGNSSTCASTDGVIFYFKSAVVDQAPDNFLKICVAHELAHAYRAAELGMPLNDATAYGLVSHGPEEDTANNLVDEWGFDVDELVSWLAAHEIELGL